MYAWQREIKDNVEISEKAEQSNRLSQIYRKGVIKPLIPQIDFNMISPIYLVVPVRQDIGTCDFMFEVDLNWSYVALMTIHTQKS